MTNQHNFVNKYKLLFVFIFLPLLIWLPALFFFKSYVSQFMLPQGSRQLLIMLLISPILEEMVFRGLFQDLFLHYIGKPIFSILLLNIAFAIIHQRINPNLIYIFFVFASGMVFSYSKLCYKKLVFPIGLHIYYNFVYIVAIYFVVQSSPL